MRFSRTTQNVVSGKYKVNLYKGNIDILTRESTTSLFAPEIRSIDSKSFNEKMCADAAQVIGLPFEILGKRGIIPS